jgi:hypothetical protein
LIAKQCPDGATARVPVPAFRVVDQTELGDAIERCLDPDWRKPARRRIA